MLGFIARNLGRQACQFKFCVDVPVTQFRQQKQVFNRDPQKQDQDRNRTFLQFEVSPQSRDEMQSYQEQISTAFFKLKQNAGKVDEICNLLKQAKENCLKQGNFKFLIESDFRQFIQSSQPELLKNLHLLFNQHFFNANPQFVNNKTINLIIDSVKQKPEKAILLELIKYHQQFIEKKDFRIGYFHSEKEFQRFIEGIQQSNQVDILSVYYHFFHLNSTKIVDKENLKHLIESFTKIRWGSPKTEVTRLDYQQNFLSDLLFYKQNLSFSIYKRFKFTQNENLQLFLADLFFGSQSYKDALTSVSFILLMLSRLNSDQIDLSDLFQGFRKSFGDEKFEFYIEGHLTNVLRSYNQQIYSTFFQQALKLYKIQCETRTKIQWSSLSPLDKFFIQSDQIYYQNDLAHQSEPLYYSLNASFDINLPRASTKQNTDNQSEDEQIRLFTLNHDTEGLAKLIQKKYQGSSTNDVIKLSDVIDQGQRDVWESYSDKPKLTKPVPKSYTKKMQYTPRSQFSTSGKEKDSENEDLYIEQSNQQRLQKDNIGSGFLTYLKKSKEFDEHVKEEEEQEAATQPVFLRPRDNSKPKQEVKEQQGSLFGTIDIKKEEINQAQTRVTQEPINKVEEWLVQPDLLEKAKLEVDQLFVGVTKNQLLQNLDEYFMKCSQNDNYHYYAQKVLVEKLEQEDFIGNLTLMKMLCNKHSESSKGVPVQNIKRVDLTINIESRYGTMEKDYNKYLNDSVVFPYQLIPQLYNSILKAFLVQEGFYYKRLFFKRVLSHMAYFSKELNDTTIDSLLQVVITHRVPYTLIETINLFLKQNIVFSQKHIMKMLLSLRRFKEIGVDMDSLLVNCYKKYQWDLDYNDLKEYVDDLVMSGETERHLNLYDMLKDATLTKNLKQVKKEVMKQQVVDYVEKYVNALLKQDELESARKVLNDVYNQKLPLNHTFFANWMHSNAGYPEQAQKVYTQYLERFPEHINADFFTKMCIIVQKNPEGLQAQFYKAMQELVFAKKVVLNPELVQLISETYQLVNDISGMKSLLRIIYDEKIGVLPQCRSIWFRIMKRAEDDSTKTTIKGLSDQIVAEQLVKPLKKYDGPQKKSPADLTQQLDKQQGRFQQKRPDLKFVSRESLQTTSQIKKEEKLPEDGIVDPDQIKEKSRKEKKRGQHFKISTVERDVLKMEKEDN